MYSLETLESILGEKNERKCLETPGDTTTHSTKWSETLTQFRLIFVTFQPFYMFWICQKLSSKNIYSKLRNHAYLGFLLLYSQHY